MRTEPYTDGISFFSENHKEEGTLEDLAHALEENKEDYMIKRDSRGAISELFLRVVG